MSIGRTFLVLLAFLPFCLTISFHALNENCEGWFCHDGYNLDLVTIDPAVCDAGTRLARFYEHVADSFLRQLVTLTAFDAAAQNTYLLASNSAHHNTTLFTYQGSSKQTVSIALSESIPDACSLDVVAANTLFVSTNGGDILQINALSGNVTVVSSALKTMQLANLCTTTVVNGAYLFSGHQHSTVSNPNWYVLSMDLASGAVTQSGPSQYAGEGDLSGTSLQGIVYDPKTSQLYTFSEGATWPSLGPYNFTTGNQTQTWGLFVFGQNSVATVPGSILWLDNASRLLYTFLNTGTTTNQIWSLAIDKPINFPVTTCTPGNSLSNFVLASQ